MNRKLGLALALVAFLGGCATYTDRTSPCACDWQPINTEEAVV